MTTELAIYNASVPDRMRYAEALSGASLLPDSYRGKPANVLLALEYGAALGIPPMVAIQQVHVIQGRPVASAQLIGALVRKAGHRLRVSGDDRRAVCEIVRADDPDFTFRSEWTIERAQAAKLTGKDTWRQYPANMLRARAITECARDACPEALAGVSYTAEELGDDTLPAEAYPQTGTASESAHDAGHGSAEIAAPGLAVSDDIEDAIVVEETPDAGGGGEAPPASASRYTGPDDPSLTRRYGKPTEPAGKASITRLILAMADAGIPKDDRDANLAWCAERIGRDIETRNDLTAAEVGYLLDHLRPGAT